MTGSNPFTTTPPTIAATYWLKERRLGNEEVTGKFHGGIDGWTIEGIHWLNGEVETAWLFGPRIPSPEELAGNTTNEEKSCES